MSIRHFSWAVTSTGTSTCDGEQHGLAAPPETELVAKQYSTPGLKRERVKKVSTELAEHDMKETPAPVVQALASMHLIA